MISDHTVVLTIDESKVPVSEFRDIVNGKLKTMSQLINLMAHLKNLTEEPHERSLNLQLDIFLQCLKMALRSIDDDQDEFRMIEFIIEQVKLIAKLKYGRHYSAQLTIFSYIVYTSSSSAYATLLGEKVLCFHRSALCGK